MKRLATIVGIFLLSIALSHSGSAQEDVRAATGMPIPINADVIWGQVELRGLRSDEKRPVLIVALMFNGAQLDMVQVNDKGYYVFLRKAQNGAELVVRIGGEEIGRVKLYAALDRYDIAVNWSQAQAPKKAAGVISAKSSYNSRSNANQKLLDKAIVEAESKNIQEAIKILRDIVASDPQDFVAWAGLGSLYFGESKLADAEKAYDRALELNPDLMVAMLKLGRIHLSNKAFDKAIAILEKAVVADPTSADALHFLGEAYLQAKLGSKAVPVLNEAIRLAPVEKADLHLRLAALYNAAGLKDRAAAEYKLFLGKKPNYGEKDKLEKYIKDNQKEN
jgi:cytochrome c-type biogenesis protein CcmH/NrfG